MSARIRQREQWPGSDREFLETYYEQLRTRLERKLLFGRRRVDKHDL